jgi:transmembrane sensor
MMENEFNMMPYELIISSFNRALSVEEQQQITAWRYLSSENEELYQQITSLDQDIELLPVYQKLNPDSSWDKFKPLLEAKYNPSKTVKLEPSAKNNYLNKLNWILPIAASLLLVAWFSIYQYNNKNHLIIVSTKLHEHKMIKLSDGTSVLMNENTTVSYNRSTYDQYRTFDLIEGEAFFNVIHNAKNPFKVRIDKIDVDDIGTSFNIRKEKQKIIVVVNSGVVSLTNKAIGKKVLVIAQQKAIYDIASDKITSGANDERNYKAWTDKNLQFIKTPLVEVINELEGTYGATIYLEDNSLKNKTLTASFNNQQIDSVLNVISLSLQIKIEKKNNVFHIGNSSF